MTIIKLTAAACIHYHYAGSSSCCVAVCVYKYELLLLEPRHNIICRCFLSTLSSIYLLLLPLLALLLVLAASTSMSCLLLLAPSTSFHFSYLFPILRLSSYPLLLLAFSPMMEWIIRRPYRRGSPNQKKFKLTVPVPETEDPVPETEDQQ